MPPRSAYITARSRRDNTRYPDDWCLYPICYITWKENHNTLRLWWGNRLQLTTTETGRCTTSTGSPARARGMFGVSRGQGFANIKNKVTRQPFSRGRGFVQNGLMQENGREGKNGNKSIYAENQKETITQGKRTARTKLMKNNITKKYNYRYCSS